LVQTLQATEVTAVQVVAVLVVQTALVHKAA
jgi:hypothetical protein